MPGVLVIKFPDGKNPTRIDFKTEGNLQLNAAEAQFSLATRSAIRIPNRISSVFGKASYEENPLYRDCYDQFFDAAQTGLQHPNGNVANGRLVLEQARRNASFVLGRKVRNQFIGRMITIAGLELLLSIIILIFAHQIGYSLSFIFSDISSGGNMPYSDGSMAYRGPDARIYNNYVMSVGLAGIGNYIGLTLTNIWYLRDITWDKVDFLDPAGLPPWIRVFGVALLTVLLIVLLGTRVIIVGIMSITLNDFAGNLGLSLLVGVLCGLSEVPVVGLIQRAFRPTVRTATDTQHDIG